VKCAAYYCEHESKIARCIHCQSCTHSQFAVNCMDERNAGHLQHPNGALIAVVRPDVLVIYIHMPVVARHFCPKECDTS